ncbi:MAG: type II toxin-antitoxin system Phd/YefM family antitoxin [Deltaproteobacteria bacterium]|nr:type II toxin-antitoxin system Phd/YefM family antitoxin [Deltaproteobacteria bacterium]
MGLVEAGEEVVIARYGIPIGKLVRAEPVSPNRQPGTWANHLGVANDFDDKLGEEWMEPLEP